MTKNRTKRVWAVVGLMLGLLVSFGGFAQATVMIDMTTVGDPGNPADTLVMNDNTTGYGSVGYTFNISKYEVTNAQYAEFLNAVAATDTYALYADQMTSSARGGIQRSGTSGSYTYVTKPYMDDKPVIAVSWFDALRFINWLENGQPVGLQDASTTEDGAYTFTGASSVGGAQ